MEKVMLKKRRDLVHLLSNTRVDKKIGICQETILKIKNPSLKQFPDIECSDSTPTHSYQPSHRAPAENGVVIIESMIGQTQ